VLPDWQALDARLADWPPGLVVNVTDRGARLRNTTLVHPRSVAMVRAPSPKRPALSRLPAPVPRDLAAVRAACHEIGVAGTQGCRTVAAVRENWGTGGAVGATAALRVRFAEGEFARIMGAFSLKVMPHLCTPEPIAPDLLRVLLEELEELSCLAEGLYDIRVE